MSERSLLTLCSDFETGARCFHDLRCLCSQCPRLQYHRVEPILDKLAAPHMGGRPETHTFYGNMASDEQETEWIFRFYGDRDGAHRFWEMATGAGGYLDPNAIPLLPRRRKRRPIMVGEGAFWWMRAIFTVAWNWKKRPGLALRADKVKLPGSHGVPYYSILPINPFSASVMLIDVLLSDVGSGGKQTQAADGDGGSAAEHSTARRTQTHTDTATPVTEEREATALDDLVTLDQAAAVVGRSKRSLELYLQRGDLPRPDLPGGGGKAHRWYWNTLRPALEKHFRPDLPLKFPASRVV